MVAECPAKPPWSISHFRPPEIETPIKFEQMKADSRGRKKLEPIYGRQNEAVLARRLRRDRDEAIRLFGCPPWVSYTL